jgi:hypothetical protein
MYNMDISIFGFKINLEVLILIGVVYLILVGHTVCGCFNYSLIEGLDNMMKTDASGNSTNDNMPTQMPVGGASAPTPAGNMIAGAAKNGSSNANGKAGKEGFVGANTNYGQSSPYDISSYNPINTSSWSKPNMTVVPGQPLSQGVKQFLEREPQPVPLPEGEMLMFANTPFKPECCPNSYSTSTGCACMTGPQYNYLILRGGNNTPYSEF